MYTSKSRLIPILSSEKGIFLIVFLVVSEAGEFFENIP